MKHLVYYDDQTGNITGENDFFLGCIATGMQVPQPAEPKNNSKIDDLIKLKASGFTADELIKMGVKL